MSLKTLLPPPQTAAQQARDLFKKMRADGCGEAAATYLADNRVDDVVQLIYEVMLEVVGAAHNTSAAKCAATILSDIRTAERETRVTL
ncbi:hypothetical protein UFOVP141_35 [uncultured Caudovirales phage]|uniref:Uncharacterized protein n=1 Tax=uncultured Caudovirales phage TaxID=2100421 RepID=A0A6J7VKK0_9CAUD|nr:hypothetical protein UFOVP141_35 [uncultured Caudovirales phage]